MSIVHYTVNEYYNFKKVDNRGTWIDVIVKKIATTSEAYTVLFFLEWEDITYNICISEL